jgi:hypothetical protein
MSPLECPTVLFIAISLVALRDPSPLMASVSFSLAVLILSVAALLGCIRRGQSRAAWIGMAAFGLTYLHFGFVGGDPAYPAFITTALFASIAEQIPGPVMSMDYWSLGRRFSTSTTSFVSRALRSGFDKYAFGQVCYSLAAILLGVIGAFVGRMLADRGDPSQS